RRSETVGTLTAAVGFDSRLSGQGDIHGEAFRKPEKETRADGVGPERFDELTLLDREPSHGLGKLPGPPIAKECPTNVPPPLGRRELPFLEPFRQLVAREQVPVVPEPSRCLDEIA